MKFSICSALCVLLVIGCGSSTAGTSGNGSSGAVSAFVGTWKYVSGQATLNCPTTGFTQTIPGVGTIAITAGTAAGTIVTTASSTNCTIVYTVSGTTATVEPGQSCMITGTDSQTGATETETRTVNTATISVTNGNMLSADQNVADVINEGTMTVNCTLSGMLSYTKL